MTITKLLPTFTFDQDRVEALAGIAARPSGAQVC